MKRVNALAVGSVVALVAACGGAIAPAINDGEHADAGHAQPAGSASSDGGGRTNGTTGPDAAISPDMTTGFVPCGPSSCAVSGGRLGAAGSYCCIEAMPGGRTDAVCTDAGPSACNGVRVACDESADCKDGNVCCTEPGDTLVTACRPSCITGATRVQVCTKDDECENGGPCRAYDCGEGLPALLFCERPEHCR